MVAEGIATALTSYPDLTVIGIVATCAGARESVVRLRPNVVLLEQQLPDGLGTDVLADLKSIEPKMKVLMEDIKHHVQEEEGQMFPMVEKQFNEETLRNLGEAVEKAKAKFQKSGSASA